MGAEHGLLSLQGESHPIQSHKLKILLRMAETTHLQELDNFCQRLLPVRRELVLNLRR